MLAPEVALALLTVAILANAGLMAIVLAFALWGRGPLSLVIRRRPETDEGADDVAPASSPLHPGSLVADTVGAELTTRPATGASTPVRRTTRSTLAGSGQRRDRMDPAVQRLMRPSDDELDDVLKGRTAAAAYNKTIRILTWAFIISCLVIVSATELWNATRPQIMVVLALAGIFVLVVHELMPPVAMGTARSVFEGSAAIVFVTLLVLLTGNGTSPFFFVYPLLVGAAALVATPAVTLILTIEACVAYTLAALSGGTVDRATLAYLGINLTALLLLAYAGVVISGEQRRTRDAAIRLSTVDSLTSLYNRAYFFTALDREIQRSRRFRRDFCLLMMDLDGLKSVNDRFGHYHGDLMLKTVSRAMTELLRKVDVASRYGGDEFVVLLPETDRAGAYVAAEKIRQAVAALTVEAGGQHITTSLSVGLVSFPEDGQTADELMIAADDAMYSSKRLGKNRVVGFEQPAPEAVVGVAGGSNGPGGSAGAAMGIGTDGGPAFGSVPGAGGAPAFGTGAGAGGSVAGAGGAAAFGSVPGASGAAGPGGPVGQPGAFGPTLRVAGAAASDPGAEDSAGTPNHRPATTPGFRPFPRESNGGD